MLRDLEVLSPYVYVEATQPFLWNVQPGPPIERILTNFRRALARNAAEDALEKIRDRLQYEEFVAHQVESLQGIIEHDEEWDPR